MKVCGLIGTKPNGAREYIGAPMDGAEAKAALGEITAAGGKGYADVKMFAISSHEFAKRRKFEVKAKPAAKAKAKPAAK